MNYISYFLSKPYFDTIDPKFIIYENAETVIKGLGFEKSSDNYEPKEIKLGKTFHTSRKNISQKSSRKYDFFLKKQAILQLHKLKLALTNCE
jgi:hypothetical protein